MNKKTVLKKTILAVSIAMLTACGGSGNNSDIAPVASTSTIEGVITGFGSIYVNGVEYETDNASIEIDGNPSIETSLGIGDVVVLQGSINADGLTGVANRVSSVDELEGYVLDLSNLNVGVGSINVMGQVVNITIDTVFDSNTLNSIDELSINDIVEISGFSDGNGNILATRVETQQSADNVELKGVISNLDIDALVFTIGTLTIDFSSAFEVPAILNNGLLVEVKTQTVLTGSLIDGFVLIASQVEIEDDGGFEFDEGVEIERQGLVSDVTDTTFLFNGELIQIASLKVDDDFASLENGMLITAEGFIDANGVFIIEKIENIELSDFEFEGLVTAKTETEVTVTNNGVEITFIVNNSTRLMDEQDEGVTPIRFFSLADVALGEYLTLKYFVDINGKNIATELEREDNPTLLIASRGL
ncbi:hypothetical protein MNBD_GAMMA07-1419 [hydrothermal vent metagenome]|uniref:DUF5666 domain-containing protein n=1 Tax=hydrothermal vent metagenome TaxID=652676 RepID=A0A3B0WM13_9ZZZZ